MAVVVTEEFSTDDYLRREKILKEAVALGQKWGEMSSTTRNAVSGIDDELADFLDDLEELTP